MAGLFKKPEMPKVEPATPLPDDKELSAARRRRVAQETKTTGSDSTILSGGGRETLGG